jgi:hypothetical protein
VTISTWFDLPGVITPADIAHDFIETHNSPNHDKVESRAGTFYRFSESRWPLLGSTYNVACTSRVYARRECAKEIQNLGTPPPRPLDTVIL